MDTILTKPDQFFVQWNNTYSTILRMIMHTAASLPTASCHIVPDVDRISHSRIVQVTFQVQFGTWSVLVL